MMSCQPQQLLSGTVSGAWPSATEAAPATGVALRYRPAGGFPVPLDVSFTNAGSHCPTGRLSRPPAVSGAQMVDTQYGYPGQSVSHVGITPIPQEGRWARGSLPGRRGFLRAAATGCALCLSAMRAVAQHAAPGAAGAAPPHWNYEGEAGPTHWGELSPDFKVCQLGMEQSPLDLASGITAGAGGVDPAYRAIPLRIINNGHTIQINADPGCVCLIGGTQFELLQFHFHHPSEHLLSGRSFDLECHFVHRSAAGNLAVSGFL